MTGNYLIQTVKLWFPEQYKRKDVLNGQILILRKVNTVKDQF